MRKNVGALENSFMKIRENATKLKDQRKYDPKKFMHVKSKISRNIKVINATNR